MGLIGRGISRRYSNLPSFIDTPLTRKNDHKMPFLMSSEEAASEMYNAIEKRMPFCISLANEFINEICRKSTPLVLSHDCHEGNGPCDAKVRRSDQNP